MIFTVEFRDLSPKTRERILLETTDECAAVAAKKAAEKCEHLRLVKANF